MMLYKKLGFPEEGEILMCTVTNVQYNSVFATIDEYGKSGMIHISEVSPGRIRNIRDYVVEGKKIVCKVLRIHRDRGHIDLSLRRVSEGQRRKKVNQLKKEQVCEKIIEFVAGNLKVDVKKLYDSIFQKIKDEYEGLSEVFSEIVKDEFDIKNLGIDKKTEKLLDETIRQRIKPEIVRIKGEFNLVSYDIDGLNIIKSALKKGEEVEGDYTIKYKGAGKYTLEITAENYKDAEEILSRISDNVINYVIENNGQASFARIDKK